MGRGETEGVLEGELVAAGAWEARITVIGAQEDAARPCGRWSEEMGLNDHRVC